MSRRKAFAAILVSSLALSACVPGFGGKTAKPADRPALPYSGELSAFYNQKLNWGQCPEQVASPDARCATIEVPKDYAKPGGEKIKLVLGRIKATGGKSLGSLLVNPGGPGGSGLSTLTYFATKAFSKKLTKNYDIVSFDPRGVGASTAVDCLTDEEVDKGRSGEGTDFKFDTAQGRQKYASYVKKIAAQCVQKSGDLIRYVNTDLAARDMDVMRSLLGDEKLNYLGYSYGTLLGAVYAGKFPGKVGRMVLDGAVDPAIKYEDLAKLQAAGFEKSLRAFVEDCQAGSKCPLAGDADAGMKRIGEFLKHLEVRPLRTGDANRPLTVGLAVSGIVGPLYSRSYWSVLVKALDGALLEQDGSKLLALSDAYADRGDDGKYKSNSHEAFIAINAADYAPSASDAEELKREQELKRDYPILGQNFAWSSLLLRDWPVKGKQREPIKAAGAAPIMVIGTKNDPATPYVMAQSLAKQLDSGFLVTWDGWDHTAYGNGPGCITDAVDGFLVDGEKPKKDLVCK